MILTGEEIKKEIKNKNIIIKPFNLNYITTNSYDLTLGKDFLVYTEKILDPIKKNKYEIKKIPKEGLELKKGEFILACSNEKIGSDKYVPIIHAKSSIARLGLFVHVTADLIDIGYYGNITFQLYATLPVKIYPDMLLGQVSFWIPKGEIKLYNGKYQDSKGPRASEIQKDFKKSKNK